MSTGAPLESTPVQWVAIRPQPAFTISRLDCFGASLQYLESLPRRTQLPSVRSLGLGGSTVATPLWETRQSPAVAREHAENRWVLERGLLDEVVIKRPKWLRTVAEIRGFSGLHRDVRILGFG